ALRLIAPNDPDFFALLLEKIAHAPDFFRDAPLVLDVAPIAEAPPIDLEDFVARLREHRLVAVGLQNASAPWYDAATRIGLARFGSGGAAAEPRAQPPAAADTAAAPSGEPAAAA